MNHLNKLPSNALQVKTETDTSPQFYQVVGDEISWRFVQNKNSATFNSDENTHFWGSFLDIYSQTDAQKFNITRANGGVSDILGFEDIWDAYNTTGFWFANIGDTAFRASFAPHMTFTIPISGGSGTLSGLTNVNLHSGFVEQSTSKSPDSSGPCSCWLVDTLCSESDPVSTYEAGLGYAYDGVNNPSEQTNGQYQSGFVHMFANEIYYSGNTGTTWDVGLTAATRYTFGGSPLAIREGNERNKSVGMFFVDSGNLVIYNTELVNSFNSAIGTGSTVTGLTFNTTDCYGIVRDKDVTSQLLVTIQTMPNTFKDSTNKSQLDAKQVGIECEEGTVKMTKFCLYDNDGRMTALGNLSIPTTKKESDFNGFTAKINLDGGTQGYVYDEGNYAGIRATYGTPT